MSELTRLAGLADLSEFKFCKVTGAITARSRELDRSVRIADLPDYIRNDENVAIGSLLAAAPELLEALERIATTPTAGEYESEYDGRVYTLCSGCDFQDDVRPQHAADCVFQTARAAITKATGETV